MMFGRRLSHGCTIAAVFLCAATATFADDVTPAPCTIADATNYDTGVVFVGRQKTNEAIECFKLSLEHDPSKFATYDALFQVYNNTNQTELALQTFRQAIKQFPERIDLQDRYLGLFFEKQDYAGVIREGEELLLIFSSSIVIRLHLIRALYETAVLLSNKDDRESLAQVAQKTLIIYDQLMQLGTDEITNVVALSDAHFRAADLYYFFEKTDLAIKIQRKAVELNPTRVNEWIRLSNWLYADDYKRESKQVLKTAIATLTSKLAEQPGIEDILYEAHLAYGNRAFALDDFNEAVVSYRTIAQRVRPKDQFKLFYNIALCEIYRGEFAAAHEYIAKTLEVSPANPHVLADQALLSLAADNYDHAISLLPKISPYLTQNLSRLEAKARVQLKAHRYQDAVKTLQYSLSLTDKSKPSIHYFLMAKALAGNGEYEAAEQMFQTLLQINPDYFDVKIERLLIQAQALGAMAVEPTAEQIKKIGEHAIEESEWNSTSADLFSMVTQLLVDQRQERMSQELVDLATTKWPEIAQQNPYFFYATALVLKLQGKDTWITKMHAALAKLPLDTQVNRHMVNAFLQTGDTASALRSFRRSYATFNPILFFRTIESDFGWKDDSLKASITSINQLIRSISEPEVHASALFFRALFESMTENYEAAVFSLKSSLELNAKNTQAFFLLVELQHRLQRHDAANDAMKKLKELNPTFAEIMKLRIENHE